MYDTEGWIDSAEQSDDKMHGIWCALIAIAKSQERIARYTDAMLTARTEAQEDESEAKL